MEVISFRVGAPPLVRRQKIEGREGGGTKLAEKQLCVVKFMLTDPINTGRQVADQFGVHRGALYRALRDYRQRRDAKK